MNRIWAVIKSAIKIYNGSAFHILYESEGQDGNPILVLERDNKRYSLTIIQHKSISTKTCKYDFDDYDGA